MAAAFVELTRVQAETGGTSVLVNLGAVAWIEPGANGTSLIVFAVGTPSVRDGAGPLTLVVRESAQEIGVDRPGGTVAKIRCGSSGDVLWCK